MKRFFLTALLLGLFLAAVPGLISRQEQTEPDKESFITEQPTDAFAGSEETIAVFLPESNRTQVFPLREYLLGVVAAEMPAAYEQEALKAQALAALSYARYTLQTKDAIPADSETAQGFWTDEEMKERWGEKHEENRQKILSAVDAVKDLCLEYDGKPILAAYFALSGGRTENAEDIWGGEYPYLSSVTSSGDALSSGLTTTKTMDKDTVRTALSKIRQPVQDELTVGEIERTEGGSVHSVIIGGTSYTGAEVRNALELDSANFTIEEDDDHLLFTVTGRGHGVGMSQYGADYMARQGADFTEILLHYYPGAVIVRENAEAA